METAYCMKCKKKREMISVHKMETKRGVPMSKGKCKTCGCKMCRMGK